MNAIDWFWHIVNFMAPALWLGLAMAAWDKLTHRKTACFGRWWCSLLLDWGIGIAVLLGGLAVTDHDGRIFTYAVLVLAVSTWRWLVTIRQR